MSLEIEYELTYLAKFIPKEINKVEPKTITDYYVPETDCIHPTLRIRKNGGRLEITKKEPVSGTDSSEQNEHTIILRQDEYDDLIASRSRMASKDRYKVNIGGHMAEVDVFKDKLQGLVLIDFEFKSKEEKDAFIPPDVCLADVTQEEFIAGGILPGKTYQDIEPKLKKYGYKKLAV